LERLIYLTHISALSIGVFMNSIPDGGNMNAIEWIVEQSKSILMDKGSMAPLVIVELSEKECALLFAPQMSEARDTHERAYSLGMMGRRFAQDARKILKVQKVTRVFAVIEVWYADVPKGSLSKYSRSSMHPRRKEGLSISCIDAVTLKQTLQVFEIVRTGGSIDLVEDGQFEGGDVHGPLLPSFLAGINTAKQDISIARHALRRILEKDTADLQKHLDKMP
jgi:hypothetical protein